MEEDLCITERYMSDILLKFIFNLVVYRARDTYYIQETRWQEIKATRPI